MPDQAGVPAEAMDDRARFLIEHGQILRRAFVAVAGQRKFLPDHDPLLVTDVEERRFVDDAAAPNAKDVHVRRVHHVELLAVGCFIQPAVENIRRHPVGTLGEN
jgi:hypothetical protein